MLAVRFVTCRGGREGENKPTVFKSKVWELMPSMVIQDRELWCLMRQTYRFHQKGRSEEGAEVREGHKAGKEMREHGVGHLALQSGLKRQ